MGSNAAVALTSLEPKQQPLPRADDVHEMGTRFIRDVRMYYMPYQHNGDDPYYYEYRLTHYGHQHDRRVDGYFQFVLETEAGRCDKHNRLGRIIHSSEEKDFFSVRIEFQNGLLKLQELEDFRLALEKAFLLSVEHGSRALGCF